MWMIKLMYYQIIGYYFTVWWQNNKIAKMTYGLWVSTFKHMKNSLNMSINITLRTRRSRNRIIITYDTFNIDCLQWHTHTHIYMIYIYMELSIIKLSLYRISYYARFLNDSWCVSLVKWRGTFNWFLVFVYVLYWHYSHFVHHTLTTMASIKFCQSYIISITFLFEVLCVVIDQSWLLLITTFSGANDEEVEWRIYASVNKHHCFR